MQCFVVRLASQRIAKFPKLGVVYVRDDLLNSDLRVVYQNYEYATIAASVGECHSGLKSRSAACCSSALR